jgi:RNA polymerase sigma-70 factor, ECF subfamily
MQDENEELTGLLRRMARGDREAEALLFETIYPKLKRAAEVLLRMERSNHTLQPTALVNEAFLRLPRTGTDWQGTAHFLGVVARVMRRILVDHARRRAAEKRPTANKRVELPDTLVYDERDPVALLAVNEALDRLEAADQRLGRVVEMRYFGGMTEDEIAVVLGITSRTVKRDWQFAKLWLRSQLSDDAPAATA